MGAPVPIKMESPRVRALQQLSRSDLLGADTLGSVLPFCPPTGSRRHELELAVGTCFGDLTGLVVEVVRGVGVATSQG